jgi:TolB protein
MTTQRRSIAHALAAAAAGILLAVYGQVPMASPTPTTRIAFQSNRDGNSEIYVMNVDGTAVTRLTNHYADDADPAWSPDGTRIVFMSDRDGNEEIYVMNADGTGLTRLTNHPADDGHPDWR